MSIPVLLTNYLAAKARRDDTMRLMLRAGRTAQKLARRKGGSDAAWARACTIAGVTLADHRDMAAYREMERARAALVAALRREPVHTRLAVVGAVLCADLPRPANDWDGRGRRTG
jgi:hypothetical protein